MGRGRCEQKTLSREYLFILTNMNTYEYEIHIHTHQVVEMYQGKARSSEGCLNCCGVIPENSGMYKREVGVRVCTGVNPEELTGDRRVKSEKASQKSPALKLKLSERL